MSESQRSGRGSKHRYGRQCVCGKQGECRGVSAAFKLMGDPRKGYVQLPLHQEYPKPSGVELVLYQPQHMLRYKCAFSFFVDSVLLLHSDVSSFLHLFLLSMYLSAVSVPFVTTVFHWNTFLSVRLCVSFSFTRCSNSRVPLAFTVVVVIVVYGLL